LRGACGRLGLIGQESFQITAICGSHRAINRFLAGTNDLDALNGIAACIARLEPYEVDKLCALTKLDLSGCGTPAHVLWSVVADEDNFAGFDLIDAHNVTELGRYWLREESCESSSDLEAAYGRENMKDGGVFTRWGYVYMKRHPAMLPVDRGLSDHLRGAELGAEQNYNMAGDGLLNDIAPSKPALADSQTWDEASESTPGTLPEEMQPAGAKPSLLGQLGQYKDAAASAPEGGQAIEPELEL
jgi:hypothetical protein